jgi:hypothetical protein
LAVLHRIGETLQQFREHLAILGRPVPHDLAQQLAPCGRDGGDRA